MTVLRWEEPPTTRWLGVADALRANPGQWARVADGMTNGGAHSARRILRNRGMKASIRKVDGEGWSVWAMFPPEAS